MKAYIYRTTEEGKDAWDERKNFIMNNFKGIRLNTVFSVVKWEKNDINVYPPAYKNRGCQTFSFNYERLKEATYLELQAIEEYLSYKQKFGIATLCVNEASKKEVTEWIKAVNAEEENILSSQKRDASKIQQSVEKKDYTNLNHQIFEKMIKSVLQNMYYLKVESIDSVNMEDGELDLELPELNIQVELQTTCGSDYCLSFWKLNRAAELKQRNIKCYFLFKNFDTDEEMFTSYENLIELVGLRSVGNKKIHATHSIEKKQNGDNKGFLVINKIHLQPINLFYRMIEKQMELKRRD